MREDQETKQQREDRKPQLSEFQCMIYSAVCACLSCISSQKIMTCESSSSISYQCSCRNFFTCEKTFQSPLALLTALVFCSVSNSTPPAWTKIGLSEMGLPQSNPEQSDNHCAPSLLWPAPFLDRLMIDSYLNVGISFRIENTGHQDLRHAKIPRLHYVWEHSLLPVIASSNQASGIIQCFFGLPPPR